jgi:hypothetical protein
MYRDIPAFALAVLRAVDESKLPLRAAMVV